MFGFRTRRPRAGYGSRPRRSGGLANLLSRFAGRRTSRANYPRGGYGSRRRTPGGMLRQLLRSWRR